MAVDLMEMVKQAVSKQIMGQIGGMLGTDKAKTSSAFETIAGSILGGLMKKAGSQQGAEIIFESAKKQDDGILDKLGDLLGGGAASDELEKSGGNILETIFGGDHSGIMEILTKAVGLDGNLVQKLLKVAAPIIMAVIGKYIKGKALDASGLGNLLGEQKKYLGNYLPASLTSDLGIAGMLDDAGKAVSNAGQSASTAATDATNQGAGLLKILLPIVILVLGGWAIWKFVLTDNSPNVPKPGISAPEVDLSLLGKTGTTLQEGFRDITNGLTDLKSESGANELVTNMRGFTEKIDTLGIGDLTGPAKSAASTMIQKFVEQITDLVDKIADENLKSIVKPAVDAMLKKLVPFTG